MRYRWVSLFLLLDISASILSEWLFRYNIAMNE